MTKENARNAQDCHLDLGLCKKRVKRRNDRIVNKVNAGNKLSGTGGNCGVWVMKVILLKHEM